MMKHKFNDYGTAKLILWTLNMQVKYYYYYIGTLERVCIFVTVISFAIVRPRAVREKHILKNSKFLV